MSFESFTSSKVPSPRKFPVATHALLLCATSGFHLCQHHNNSSCMTCLVSGLPVCSSILSPFLSEGSHSKHRGLRVSSSTTNTDQMQLQISKDSSDLHLPPTSIFFWWHWVNLAVISFSPMAILLAENHTPGFHSSQLWDCKAFLWEYQVLQASKSSAILN